MTLSPQSKASVARINYEIRRADGTVIARFVHLDDAMQHRAQLDAQGVWWCYELVWV